jgi:DNA-binding transcriptional MerR regulator
VASDPGRILLPIGRFAKLTQLTVKALRLYDQLGLLQPARVDRATGYRYYALAQVELAERIRLLRSLEVPLDEVREILAGWDSCATVARLRAHRRRILWSLDRLAAPVEPAPSQVTGRG